MTQIDHSTSNDTVLVDLAPLIIREILPVSPPITPVLDGGINHVMLERNLNGLLVELLNYPTRAVDDFIQIYWGDATRSVASVRVKDLTSAIALWVPSVKVPQGIHEVYYTVQHPGSHLETSGQLQVLVKRDLPGGSAPGQLAAPQLPADIIANGVDGPAARAGVEVTIAVYIAAAQYDTVELNWGGELIRVVVTDASVPLVITVDEARILAAGDADGVVLMYRVWDVVQNVSAGWSLPTRVKVTASGDTLMAAVLSGVSADGKLDLAQLGREDLKVQVIAMAPIQTGDRLNVTWQGKTADGVAVDVELLPRNHTVIQIPELPEFLVPNEKVRAVAGGTATVHYTASQGADVFYSKRAYVSIIGQVPGLEAPQVAEDNNGTLDPDLARVTVTIAPYAGMVNGDHVDLFWLGTLSDGAPLLHTVGRAISDNLVGQPVSFLIAGDKIKILEGGTVEVYYQVRHRDVILALESQRLVLQVGEPSAQLADPWMEGEVNNVLNPDDFPGGTDIVIPVYDNMQDLDDVFVTFAGTASGSFTDHLQLSTSDLGHEVRFWVLPNYIEQNRDKDVDIFYRVEQVGLRTRSSKRHTVHIGVAARVLPPPTVKDLDSDGVLNPVDATSGAQVTIDYRGTDLGQQSGDTVVLEWAGEGSDGTYTTSVGPLSGGQAANPLEFLVPYQYVLNNIDLNVQVAYRVAHVGGEQSRSTELPVHIAKPLLERPGIAQATGPGNDQLNPSDVPNGATVQIPVSTQLKQGERLTVVVEGKDGNGSTQIAVDITADQGAAPFPVTLPYAVVVANDRASFNLHYKVLRSGVELLSAVATFDVATVAAPGLLQVMGARYNESTYRASGAPRRLSALHATTLQPLQASWKYSTGNTWTTAATWRDTRPGLPLQVRFGEDLVTLSPANIVGTGNDTTVNGTAAFIALRDGGDLRAWGNAAYGGSIEPAPGPVDVVEVSGTRSAGAARRVSGVVQCWPPTNLEGGNMGSVSSSDFLLVRSGGVAFAGIKGTGQVVAWGDTAGGGNVPGPISSLRNVVTLRGNGNAFAALTADGEVKAWGATSSGGTVPSDLGQASNITDLMGNYAAFVVLHSSGIVSAWGGGDDPALGGVLPADIIVLNNVVELSSATARAFAIRLATGQVKVWGGGANYGGALPDALAGLTDIVEISSTWQAFAGVRATGQVVAWGATTHGGEVPAAIAQLTDIVQVCGTSKAFAALRRDGTVVAWGDQTLGGDTAPVVARLQGIRAIYANSMAFTALGIDGRVVTWGQAAGGGNSDAVAADLQGNVSYVARGATRGLAAIATRARSLR